MVEFRGKIPNITGKAPRAEYESGAALSVVTLSIGKQKLFFTGV